VFITGLLIEHWEADSPSIVSPDSPNELVNNIIITNSTTITEIAITIVFRDSVCLFLNF
jgi:hypothetical protein